MSHENVEDSVKEVAPRTKSRQRTWLMLLIVWGGLALLIGLNMN